MFEMKSAITNTRLLLGPNKVGRLREKGMSACDWSIFSQSEIEAISHGEEAKLGGHDENLVEVIADFLSNAITDTAKVDIKRIPESDWSIFSQSEIKRIFHSKPGRLGGQDENFLEVIEDFRSNAVAHTRTIVI